MFVLDPHSVANLKGVHPDLVRVLKDCCDNPLPFTFAVSEGLRTLDKQKVYLAAGKSQTMNSRHLDGRAVDLVVLIQGHATWSWPMYERLNEAMQAAAGRCGVPVTWGGSWESLRDGCHWELPRDKYPSAIPEPAEVTQA